MPYYYFDLVVGEEFKNQGGIILETSRSPRNRADQLANELSQVKPELQSKGCGGAASPIAITTSSIARRSIPCRPGNGPARSSPTSQSPIAKSRSGR